MIMMLPIFKLLIEYFTLVCSQILSLIHFMWWLNWNRIILWKSLLILGIF